MSSSTKILLVNSDRDLSDALIYQLSLNDKYQIIESDVDNVFTQINNNSFNIVIINSQPSKLNGHNLTKKLRTGGFKNPIIMLITQSDASNVDNQLTIEANEHIIKPFKYPALLKSIELQLRQFGKSEDTQHNIGSYVFKPNSKVLESKNKSIRLTEKENDILKFLYQNLETIVSREILLHEVWGYNSKVTTHTLETHIYRLRQKIEIDPANACFLITETGGYRLNP
ncbi:two-component transcriptional regulator, winged helix family protein [alpha proteobacterium HTCC2255]|nr:two-component transcriptional regulator, winged helix family protein [alpha proteobacterium HTCC2255] [Rhodobacterales bacterium HTCC2255]